MGNATSDRSCMEDMCREGRSLSYCQGEDGAQTVLLCQGKNSLIPREQDIPCGVREPAPAAREVLGEFCVRDPSVVEMQDMRSGWTGIHLRGDSLRGIPAQCRTRNAPFAQVGLNFGVRKEGLVVVRCQPPAKPSLLALNSRHNPPLSSRRVTASDSRVRIAKSWLGFRTDTRVEGLPVLSQQDGETVRQFSLAHI